MHPGIESQFERMEALSVNGHHEMSSLALLLNFGQILCMVYAHSTIQIYTFDAVVIKLKSDL